MNDMHRLVLRRRVRRQSPSSWIRSSRPVISMHFSAGSSSSCSPLLAAVTVFLARRPTCSVHPDAVSILAPFRPAPLSPSRLSRGTRRVSGFETKKHTLAPGSGGARNGATTGGGIMNAKNARFIRLSPFSSPRATNNGFLCSLLSRGMGFKRRRKCITVKKPV